MVHSYDDDIGLKSIMVSCHEMMRLNNQLIARTEQYLQHFTGTAASPDYGNICI